MKKTIFGSLNLKRASRVEIVGDPELHGITTFGGMTLAFYYAAHQLNKVYVTQVNHEATCIIKVSVVRRGLRHVFVVVASDKGDHMLVQLALVSIADFVLTSSEISQLATSYTVWQRNTRFHRLFADCEITKPDVDKLFKPMIDAYYGVKQHQCYAMDRLTDTKALTATMISIREIIAHAKMFCSMYGYLCKTIDCSEYQYKNSCLYHLQYEAQEAFLNYYLDGYKCTLVPLRKHITGGQAVYTPSLKSLYTVCSIYHNGKQYLPLTSCNQDMLKKLTDHLKYPLFNYIKYYGSNCEPYLPLDGVNMLNDGILC